MLFSLSPIQRKGLGMSFFKNVFKLDRRTIDKQTGKKYGDCYDGVDEIRCDPIPAPEISGYEPVIELSGFESFPVAVYDETPFLDVYIGNIIDCDIVVCTRAIGEEVYTNAELALAYKSVVFGRVSLPDELSFALHQGFRIIVKAICDGYDEVTGHQFSALLAKRRNIYNWAIYIKATNKVIPFDGAFIEMFDNLNKQQKDCLYQSLRFGITIPVSGSVASFATSISEDLEKEISSTPKSFCASFKIIPPKQGSKAKPHILIKNGETVYFEAYARNSSYTLLSKNINNVPSWSFVYQEEGLIRVVIIWA